MQAPNDNNIYATTDYAVNTRGRIHWGAIMAGTVIGLFFQLLLSLFGIAIGLTVIDVNSNVSAVALTASTATWLIITTLISVFIGAYASGRFAGFVSKFDGFLHGIATLSLLTVLSVFLMSTGASSLVNSGLTYSLQAARTPQGQVIMNSGQATGAASAIQNLTAQERLNLKQQADKYATTAAWLTFVTGILSLIVAGYGGLIGFKSRIGHTTKPVIAP